MSGGACCRSPARAGLVNSGLRVLPWFVPAVAWLLIPKCPACFAAWLALASGVGVSAATASHLRSALVVVSVASALYVLTRLLLRVRRARVPGR